MADNFSTRIAEALVSHDIDLSRLDAGTANRIRALFRKMGRGIIDKLNEIDPTAEPTVAGRNRRLRQVVSVANEDIPAGYDEIEKVIDADSQQIVRMEAAEVAAATNNTVGVQLMSGRLDRNTVKRLADSTLIFGAPSREWWGEQSRDLVLGFRREMREGILNNEPLSELVRRIRGRREQGFKDGLIAYNSSASRRAAAMARSSMMSVANAARFETYLENDDVIKGVQWMATLDKRTTDICKALDGEAWTLDGKRLPGTKLPWRGPPPAHWNCRSTLTPVLRSWADLAQKPKIKNRLARAEKAGGLEKGWRASMDGKVSNDLNYGDWLRKKEKQQPGFAREILGVKKYKLWQQGKINMRDLIDQSHQPFSLKELTDKLARERKK